MKPVLVSFAALLLFACSGGSGPAPAGQSKGIQEVPVAGIADEGFVGQSHCNIIPGSARGYTLSPLRG